MRSSAWFLVGAPLDLLDRARVNAHARDVAATGGIDICFNATSNDDVQGTELNLTAGAVVD